MRRNHWAIVYFLSATSCLAGDEFPCAAYVAVSRAEVVAGPGQRYYATQYLERGAKVEIHREEPSGWLAIRPPEQAFSWAPAQYIERSESDDSVGRVTQATGVWIGTAVEKVTEHRQEITLKAGEIVEILGEKSIVGPANPGQKWLKIAPPAGEFRWIHVRDVSRQPPPMEIARIERAVHANEDKEEVAPEEEPRVREPRRIELAGTEIPLRELRGSGGDGKVQAAQFSSSAGGGRTSLSPDGFVARKRRDGEPRPIEAERAVTGSQDQVRMARTLPDSGSSKTTSSGAAKGREEQGITPAARMSVGLGAEEMAKQIEQIETDLSLMLAKDRSVWDLASLKQRVERLVENGNDPTTRGKARLMLEKLKQFEGTFEVAEFGPIQRGSAATANARTEGTTGKSSAGEAQYDVQGWLKPVVSRQNNKVAAPYAVVDKDGQPVCFVTPAPGLNLQHYLNKSVGLYGRRGYLEELKKPHLTAQRVIELDRQWR